MRLLILGRGGGSWQMRGVQLGAVLGACVTSTPTVAEWAWADRVVLVKHAGLTWAPDARARDLPIVWDALDFWQQPTDNPWPAPVARAALQHLQATIQPTLTIGATAAMAHDAGGVYLPHHGRIGVMPTAARRACRVVGYDGHPSFLGPWAPALEAGCRAHGWTFVINPPDLATVDVLVALRGGVWDGWMCRQWKSGVKAVNAIRAGRPLLYQDSAATRELAPWGAVVTTPAEVADALAAQASYAWREAVAEEARGRAHAFTVEAVAAEYGRVLRSLS